MWRFKTPPFVLSAGVHLSKMAPKRRNKGEALGEPTEGVTWKKVNVGSLLCNPAIGRGLSIGSPTVDTKGRRISLPSEVILRPSLDQLTPASGHLVLASAPRESGPWLLLPANDGPSESFGKTLSMPMLALNPGI